MKHPNCKLPPHQWKVTDDHMKIPNCAPYPKKRKKLKKIKPVPYLNEESVYKNLGLLRGKTNEAIDRVNKMTEFNAKEWDKLWWRQYNTGAYYYKPDIWYEDGYSGDESTTYQVTHKSHVAKSGEPLKMEMHFAYGNTTNSRITEDAFNVSLHEKAQFCFPAQIKEDGFTGITIQNGAPLPSSTDMAKYSVAFTRRGKMRYYESNVGFEQLRRDGVENSTGCLGVLVTGKKVADETMYNMIPNYAEKTARIAIGQNYDTMEMFIVSCGIYDTNGMTSHSVAEILASYGCDIGVEVCNGEDAIMLYAGKPLFIPEKSNIPDNYIFWYLSKKKDYGCDRRLWEVSLLVQLYGQCWYRSYLNSLAIDDLQEQINQIRNEFENVLARVDELERRVENVEKTIDEIDTRINELVDRIGEIEGNIGQINNTLTELSDKLDQEIADRIRENQIIDRRIDSLKDALDVEISRLDQEIVDRIAGDKVNNDKIEQEIADRIQAIGDLQTKIDSLNSRVEILSNTVNQNYNTLLALINTNLDLITNLQDRQASLETQMQELDKTVTEILANLSTIEQALENVKQLIIELQTLPGRMTDVENKVEELTNIVNDLNERVTSSEANVQDLTNLVNSFDDRISELETHPFVVAGDVAGQEITIWDGIDGDNHYKISGSGKKFGGISYDGTTSPTNITNEIWVADFVDSEIQPLLDDINDKVSTLFTDVDTLQSAVSDHEARITSLTTRTTNIETKVTRIDNSVDGLLSDVESLQDAPTLLYPPLWGTAVTGIIQMNGRDTTYGKLKVDTTGFTAGERTYTGGAVQANKMTNEQWVEAYTQQKYGDSIANIITRLNTAEAELDLLNETDYIRVNMEMLYNTGTSNGNVGNMGGQTAGYIDFARNGNMISCRILFNTTTGGYSWVNNMDIQLTRNTTPPLIWAPYLGISGQSQTQGVVADPSLTSPGEVKGYFLPHVRAGTGSSGEGDVVVQGKFYLATGATISSGTQLGFVANFTYPARYKADGTEINYTF